MCPPSPLPTVGHARALRVPVARLARALLVTLALLLAWLQFSASLAADAHSRVAAQQRPVTAACHAAG